MGRRSSEPKPEPTLPQGPRYRVTLGDQYTPTECSTLDVALRTLLVMGPGARVEVKHQGLAWAPCPARPIVTAADIIARGLGEWRKDRSGKTVAYISPAGHYALVQSNGSVLDSTP